MIHEELKIGRWHVDFLFAEEEYDTEEGLTYLYDADASDYILVKAYHIMEDNNLNTGFTFTNKDLKEAVIVIGPTTSGDEFINTLCHEIYHLAAAIGESLGVKLDGEKPAYIAGDSMMELTKIICRLGCQDCD